MKKVYLPLIVLMLSFVSFTFAQTLMDYISEVRGDTLVVKDYWDMEEEASSINNALNYDTVDVPAGRVYELKTNGYYPTASNIAGPADREVTIAGDNYTRIVQRDDVNLLPLLCGLVEFWDSGMTLNNNVTIKNCSIQPASSASALAYGYFSMGDSGLTLNVDNCLFEHTKWVFVSSNDMVDTKLHINDCYFVNMSGMPCRRNGGVYDNVTRNTAEMIVENSTHVMAQGMMYKFRNFAVDNALFNHNTFINISGQTFETFGYQSHMAIINNIFVNCNVQAYMEGLDYGETDQDSLPMGIINVNDLPDDWTQVDRKILVENNVAYWSEDLDDVVQLTKDRRTNNTRDWYSQMITMNSRTQNMFDDDATYPYLYEGTWYEKLPNFTDSRDLLTDQVLELETFSVLTVDYGATNVMPNWRLVFLGDEYFLYSDWPIPVDLSYDDEDLLVGATGGFPVGDLNWFPEQRAQWEIQKETEHTNIEAAIEAGQTTTAIRVVNNAQPDNFALAQNYPNPFNPNTKINFTLSKAGNVTLKVYNALGQEVATLVNGFKTANTYEVTFDGSNLASGIYMYSLQFDNQSISKKMILMK